MAVSRSAAQPRGLADGEVHVWEFSRSSMQASDRTHIRRILAAYSGLPLDDVVLHSAGPRERPTLALEPPIDLSFNLSHSGLWTLLAVMRRARVGIDIERSRAGVRIDCLARRFFSEVEVAALRSIADEARETAFFHTWVRKEAYLKAVGAGVGVPAGLGRFSVSIGTGEPPAVLSTDLEPRGVSAFSLYDLDVPEGYAGALAVEGTGHRIRYMEPC